MSSVLTWAHARHTLAAVAAIKRRKPKDARKEQSVRIRITTDEKDAWSAAAEKDGRDLSGWLRHLANKAAEPSGR